MSSYAEQGEKFWSTVVKLDKKATPEQRKKGNELAVKFALRRQHKCPTN